jgi:hypothetical protein
MTMNLFPVDPRWYEQYWLTDPPPSASRKLLNAALAAARRLVTPLHGARHFGGAARGHVHLPKSVRYARLTRCC